MTINFSSSVNQVFEEAKANVARQGHRVVQPIHVLEAILLSRYWQTLLARNFGSNLDHAALLELVQGETVRASNEEVTVEMVEQCPSYNDLLARAQHEATKHKCGNVTTHCLLVALADSTKTTMPDILRQFGITKSAIEKTIPSHRESQMAVS